MGLIALNGSPLYREDDTCVAVWRSDMEKKPTELIVASKPMDCAPHSYPQILWGSGKGLKFVKGGYLCKRRKHMDKKTWAMAEFGKAELGDARLTKDWYQ